MKKKMNNKGFSLVELIIVIAIMAVLMGVLAPQYIKYVAQSKRSTDITNADQMATAYNVAIADNAVGATDKDTLTVIPVAAGVEVNPNDPIIAKGSGGNVYAPEIKLVSGGKWKIYGDETKGITKITVVSNSKENEIWPTSKDYTEANFK